MEKKLYKSRTNTKVDGVCAGIAHYFGIDVTLVRVIWLIFALNASGLLVYFVCAIVIPREPAAMDYADGHYYNEENRSN